jgi:SOS-response transcriptional repressor LexA
MTTTAVLRLPVPHVPQKGDQPVTPTAPRPAGGREPVRLAAPSTPSPFAPGREISFARIEGDLLARHGVRDGDHVALDHRAEAEHGDLAAVVGPDGRAGLWKAYPEGAWLRLSTGDPEVRARLRTPRVSGVVVAVLRKFRD